MPQFRTQQRPPALLPARPQHVPFDAGRLTSDGGLAWIAQADAVLGLCAALAGETAYAAASWPHERRVVYKAEVLAKGPNTRFVVTTRPDPPLALYNWYVQRGTAEQWIEDLKNGCFADRLSCHRFWANQFRLLLHAATYWLLDTLRRWLMRAGLPRSQLGTLRLRLIKIGGWVRERVRGVVIHLASSHPGEPLWQLLAAHSLPS
jgi:Transposase DDE domain group 1